MNAKSDDSADVPPESYRFFRQMTESQCIGTWRFIDDAVSGNLRGTLFSMGALDLIPFARDTANDRVACFKLPGWTVAVLDHEPPIEATLINESPSFGGWLREIVDSTLADLQD